MELKREIGEISRSSEFFSVSELDAQTGRPSANFAGVAVKELMDNAIDASEAASAQPAFMGHTYPTAQVIDDERRWYNDFYNP